MIRFTSFDSVLTHFNGCDYYDLRMKLVVSLCQMLPLKRQLL